jgi:hypothetical protein
VLSSLQRRAERTHGVNYGGFVKIAVILYFTQCIFGVCSPCVFSPRDPSGVNTA